ncbi:MAG: HlyD family efflux transporter periplasmic adaptor subunit [Prolixibacteraceae bacterium]
MPLEQHSDEVQEIIGKSPSWLLRSGLMVLFIFVALMLLGSWLFHYPDVIRGRVVVMSENPPAHLVARTTGRIDHLLVSDSDPVAKGQVLAVLESTARLDDIRQLKEDLMQDERFLNTFDTLDFHINSAASGLGDIQPDYSAFLRLYNNYISFIRLDYHPQKIVSLKKQVRMHRVYYDRLWSQRQIMEQELNISLEQFRRDSLLYVQEVLSHVDYRKSESELLKKRFDFNSVRTSLAETETEIIELEREQISAEKEYEDQKRQLQTELTAAFNVLKSKLDAWENTFVLLAPIGGKVTFTNYWSKNQQVKTGDVVFTVVPADASKIIGRLTLPLRGAGKVRRGQQVNIRFDNFPYMEYGMVKGTVSSVSLVPSNDNYAVEIDLPQDLKSNYNIRLPFSQEMKGDVEIITDDLRLIQRFFNPVKSLMKHRLGKQ